MKIAKRKPVSWRSKKKSAWLNCRTQTVERIPEPSDFTDYIPQDAKTMALYADCLKVGMTTLEAFVSCIEANYGGPPPKKEK